MDSQVQKEEKEKGQDWSRVPRWNSLGWKPPCRSSWSSKRPQQSRQREEPDDGRNNGGGDNRKNRWKPRAQIVRRPTEELMVVGTRLEFLAHPPAMTQRDLETQAWWPTAKLMVFMLQGKAEDCKPIG